MIKPPSPFVFINETPSVTSSDTANKKAVKAHAARYPRGSLEDQNVHDTTRTALRWNRYQKGKRIRRPLLSVNLSVEGLKAPAFQNQEAPPHTIVNVTVSNGESPKDEISPIHKYGSSSGSTGFMSPTMPGGGWAAPFVPYPSRGNAFIPLLVKHCKPNRPIWYHSCKTRKLTSDVQTFPTSQRTFQNSTPVTPASSAPAGSPWSSLKPHYSTSSS